MSLRKLAVLLLLVLAMKTVHAQEDRGRINGLVTDPTGAVVPHATVTLRGEETGVTVTKSSDAAGAYIFELLNPGLYTVDVNAQGFKKFEVQHIRVQVADHVGVNAKLQLGEASETVTVTQSGGAHLDTEDAVLGYTIEQRSVNELPLLYSNPFELQLLAPGVSSTTLSTGAHTYEGGTESAVINGGSQSGRTEFTLDGAPDTRNGGAVTTAYVPSRDFIGEFKLITSPYDASLSHTSGASLDTSLKAGGSQFHGGAQWFEQIPNVNAPQFSQGNSTAPAAKYNRESVEVDGPILRRKLFFFGGYEKQYNLQAASTTTQTVPTVAEKNGDFSALLAAGTTTTSTYTCPTNNAKLTTAPYNTYQIFNPYSTHVDPNCPALYLRDPVPGNIITNVRPIDPVAKKIISYYPDPTGSASQTASGQNNFVSIASNVDYAWDVSSRIDYNLNDRQKFFGHYIISDRRQPGKNLFFPGASGKTNILRNKAGVLDYVNTLSNSLVLDVRYSLTRFTTSSLIDAKTNATDLGINANATAGVPDVGLGFPYFSPSGYAELGNADPSFEYDTIHDGQINLTKVLNRHNLKFGVDWRLYQANQADLTNSKLFISSSGTYAKGPSSSLSNSPIGQSLASIEFGIAEGTNGRLNAQTSNNTQYWSSFIQDDWKVNPKLTVNIGLRYEYGSPIKERNGKSITYFDFNTPNPIATQAIANYAAKSNATEKGLVPVANFTANGGLHYVQPGDDLWNAQTLNFSPRFGFSYNPVRRLVVRGGWGLFFQHYAEYVQYGNPLGFTQSTSTVATTDNGVTYSATLANPFPNGLVQPTGSSAGMLQSVGTSISQFYQKSPKTPYNERFSLGVQYELPGSIVLEADYVGNFGRHLTITRDFNAVPNSFLSTSPVRDNTTNGRLTGTYPNPFNGISVTGCTLCSATTISGSQLVKPFPEFTGLTGRDNSGMSNYNAVQVSAQKRFSHGYNMSVSYQYSRTLDAISFLNAGDAKPWYGTSNSDYPQTLSVAGIYELPFGHNKPFFGTAPKWADEVIHGFQVQGTYRIASGQPLTFSNAGAVLRPGFTYANINGPSIHDYRQWFNTHAFYNVNEDSGYANNIQLVSNLRVMPLRFNNVRQDYQNLLNVGALKKFQVYKERVNMDVRAEAINALNHQVYSNPNTDPSSASFGKIGGAGNTARILQFAVEAHF
jgi:hypothetical protein